MDKTKYLIVKCNELSDPYECDADRIPLGITDDISMWSRIAGYEIYRIKSDGKFLSILFTKELNCDIILM